MPAPRESPIRFIPRSVSDTVDGDNSAAGACASLANLLWASDTPNVLLCRPANLKLSSFSGFTSPGIVSVAFQVNGIIWGMIASGLHAGHDQPFAYNIASGTFLTVSGITTANTPSTPASTGAWTPPTMDMVGSRIVVTHPGFNYSAGYAFGYFDTSGFSATGIGDTTSGSPTINGYFSISGIGPGYTISGSGIPSGATVLNTGNVTYTTTGTTNSTTTITGIPSTANYYVGQQIAGVGIPTGATIASIISSTSITISVAATASASGVTLSITGETITMSANATATANGVSITVAGGTPTTPLWAAGNTTGVLQLTGVASAVHNFNNRFYFAQAEFLVYTDTLSLNVSNASGVQVLTVGDTSNITAMAGLPFYTTTGGVLQALVVFKQYSIWQVTGDAALSTLTLNQLSGTVGTLAPRSVVAAPAGIYFVASDGVRTVNLEGQVSEPDPDLAMPFIYAIVPSRISACFNADIYRVCTQNGNKIGSPYEEYWYCAKYNSWVGPQSFRVDMAVAYQNNFIVFNNSIPGTLWESYSVQNQNDTGNTFIENGVQLTWDYQTPPMTDTGNMYANCAVRSTLDLALPGTGDVYVFQGIDTNSGVVAQAIIQCPLSEAIWDAFDWGDGTLWGASQIGLEATTIPWTQPLIFNKLAFQGSGNSSLGLRIGSLYVGYEKLGYLKQ